MRRKLLAQIINDALFRGMVCIRDEIRHILMPYAKARLRVLLEDITSPLACDDGGIKKRTKGRDGVIALNHGPIYHVAGGWLNGAYT